MSLANISVVGNLVKQPEQMCFSSGTVKTTMVLAVNKPAKGGKAGNAKADFYRVEAWGKLAELSGKYLAKGNQVGVSGRLVLDYWTDKHGKDRVTPIIEVTQLAFPPKLKVVGDEEEGAYGTSTISGEIVHQDEDFGPLEASYEDLEEEEKGEGLKAKISA